MTPHRVQIRGAGRVVVCGGRDFIHRKWLFDTLDKLRAEQGIETIITGGARGADYFALEWASANDMFYIEYRADWKAHGRSAGPKRNQKMLDEGKPDLVVAFPGGKGTADMVRRAKAAGVRVIEVAE